MGQIKNIKLHIVTDIKTIRQDCKLEQSYLTQQYGSKNSCHLLRRVRVQTQVREIQGSTHQKLPDVDLEFDSYGTPGVTGYFEVKVNDTLIHSKKNGDGYMDSEEKLQKVVDAVKEANGK